MSITTEEKALDQLKQEIENGTADYQALAGKLGFSQMRLSVHGQSIGAFTAKATHLSLDTDEEEKVSKAGRNGILYWAPYRKGQKKGIEDSFPDEKDRNIVFAFNAIRDHCNSAREVFKKHTSGVYGGDNTESYYLVTPSQREEVKAAIGKIEAELNKCVSTCVNNFDRLKELQRPTLIDALKVHAKRAKKAGAKDIDDIDEHVAALVTEIEASVVPTPAQFQSAIGFTFKERSFTTPPHLLGDPDSQAVYKEEWEKTLKTAHEDARTSLKKMCDDILKKDAEKFNAKRVPTMKGTIANFYTRQEFVNSPTMAKAVDAFRNYLVQLGFYPESEKKDDGTPAYPSSKEVKNRVLQVAQVVRLEKHGDFRSEVMALQAALDAADVVEGTSNPFANSKGRLIL